MAGQLLDTYIKVTAANLVHYVTDDIVHCNSVFGRYAVHNGDAIYCDSVGDAIVPAWPPVIVSSVVEDAADTKIVITYDMAMAVTDDTGFSVTVAGSAATISLAAAATNKITLTLSASVTVGQEILLTYDASAGNAENTNTSADAVSVDVLLKSVTNNVAA